MGDKISKILDQYLNDECLNDNFVKIDAWCDAEVEKSDYVLDPAKALLYKQQIKANINAETSTRKFTLRQAIVMVASVILVFLSFIFYFSINPTMENIKYVSRVAGPGKNLIITLSDSTEIFLNAGTEIRYPERFEKKQRNIYLIKGEAFFNVRKKENQPFIVRSGDLETKVLGTKFNVKFYKYLEDVSVAVSSGKVSVSTIDTANGAHLKSVILLPSEQAVFSKNDKALIKTKVDTTKVNSWMTGKIYFDNQKLSNVVAQLEDRFSKNIILGDAKLANYRVSLGFTSQDAFETILFAIKKSNKLSSIERNGKVILFPED